MNSVLSFCLLAICIVLLVCNTKALPVEEVAENLEGVEGNFPESLVQNAEISSDQGLERAKRGYGYGYGGGYGGWGGYGRRYGYAYGYARPGYGYGYGYGRPSYGYGGYYRRGGYW